MRKLLCFSLLLLISLPVVSGVDGKDAVVGVWNTRDKRARIQIYRNGEKFHGKVVWIKEPMRNGKPKTDMANPDPKKRNTPILGLILLRDFTYKPDKQEWCDGKVYDPISGKVYDCKMKLKDRNTLELKGYIGISLIGRTETWNRVE